ncbi:type II toxin-antitoxin system VapC family toxin [Caulobacter segnis]|uniref:type II toxin-antitoxin system VapC family toxin n=1 Tax=Caulobacter segnis TaxID=88688 RepID=UPI00240F2CFD|nr:type II toxin-antitoxin system VapC family toxin [Caulobacter segnis]MDG2520348.1 type II toxin-antitoxin system VapC family toxin [Caulobacter segnis]
MSFLIDTNIISELRKGEACDRNLARWYASIDADDIFLSALVLGEIRKGVEQVRRRDELKARMLEAWLNDVHVAFQGRILSVDTAVAEQWGRLSAIRSVPRSTACWPPPHWFTV